MIPKLRISKNCRAVVAVLGALVFGTLIAVCVLSWLSPRRNAEKHLARLLFHFGYMEGEQEIAAEMAALQSCGSAAIVVIIDHIRRAGPFVAYDERILADALREFRGDGKAALLQQLMASRSDYLGLSGDEQALALIYTLCYAFDDWSYFDEWWQAVPRITGSVERDLFIQGMEQVAKAKWKGSPPFYTMHSVSGLETLELNPAFIIWMRRDSDGS